MSKNYLTLLATFIIVTGILSGCANTGMNGTRIETNDPSVDISLKIKNPEKLQWPEGLYEAFCRYWTYRYSDRFEAAYAMEAPQFKNSIKESAAFEQYKLYVGNTSNQELIQIRFTGMDEYESSGGNTIVDLGCKFKIKDKKKGNGRTTFMTDKWIQIDGKWFHALRDPLIFPKIKYE